MNAPSHRFARMQIPAICLLLALAGFSIEPDQTATRASFAQLPTPVSATEAPQAAAPPIEAHTLQPVTFVVTAEGVTVEDAHVAILTDKAKSATSGISNDWGEVSTRLAPGRYTAVIRCQGQTTYIPVRIPAPIKSNTLRIPLSLTLPSPNPSA